jgi:crotonobetainyl-CoA:carnitine CoA-transferase CaiB-like acyl-CoA transferase
MCGAILAEMGAEVVKVESVRRPDPTVASTPTFFRRLNGGKSLLALDFADPDGQSRLRAMIEDADVLITSARPRAFVSLGLSPDRLFAANPALVWVAITGYGWTGSAASRVAFGDDAAAAGGLVRWTPGGAPRFLGDALADPVTGLAAAVGALEGLIAGGGVLVDAALARCAAGAADHLGLRAPA